MKKPVAILIGVLAFAGLGSAQARPPYPGILGEYYKDDAAIVAKSKAADKCNLCHEPAPMPKKNRNEYGKSLSEHMPADVFKMLNAPALKVALAARLGVALKATEANKHSSGKTFGEVIKAGKLPGEK